MNNLESDDESVDTPLISPFPYSDNDSDDGEVLNELIECEIVGRLRQERAINSFDRDDLAFQKQEVCFLCEGSPKSILAIKFAWSPSPIILTISSLSSILDEWGFRRLPRWHLVFSRMGLSWEGDSFVMGCKGQGKNDRDDE
ncbi:hypothetical protein Tco_1355958 [Tanacetum coccineum]